jgi:hypothetical protein
MRRSILLLTVALFGCGTALAGPEAGCDRDTVVNHLRHYEGLVRTIHAEYDDVMVEPSPEQIDLIRRVKGKEADSFIRTREECRAKSYAVQYWRKGAKQREESNLLDAELSKTKGSSLFAFDGQILRTIRNPANEPLVAAIASAKNSYWHLMPRHDPGGFLYHYYERPYSEVIAQAPNFSSAVITRASARLHQISVKWMAGGEEDTLDCLFDERFLPLERMRSVKWPHGVVFHEWKYVLSEYNPYPLDSGETVWFPGRVLQLNYNGTAPDGSLLEVVRHEYRIHKIEFNIDIPDEFFELEIPTNARVNDMVTGLGWLPPGQRPAAVLSPAERARWWWTIGVVAAALALVVVALLYVGFRRKRAAAAKA